MDYVAVAREEVSRRTILRRDWVPCKAAFIDCRTPGSDRKDNYSFIGAGVSQNADQFINLQERHGFNLGAAGMPNGVVNSLHMHFTAEVFINFGGDYRLRWGADGAQGEYVSRDGDVISVPSWIFRGFTNEGGDDGLLLTVLGQDDTGGIIWGPQVLRDAAGHGLYLTADNRLVDTVAGDAVPAEAELVKPMPEDEIAKLDTFDVARFRTRVTQVDDRRWVERPFLCSDLPGGGARLSLVIGYGLSEDRRAVPRMSEPHSFSLGWLRAEQGQGVLAHRHDHTQVVTAKTGTWRVRVNLGADEHVVDLARLDSLSIPPGAWRSFTLLDGEDGEAGELLVVTGGDGRVRLDWSADVVRHAKKAGWALDANGYRAPVSVLGMATEDD